ncbi:MAG: AMP-binding protein [Planctomycetes bacterium]|nr:AMP-binding protein [Planctomycetota bacterium]
MPFPLHHVTQGALIEMLAQERPDHEALVYPDGGLRWTFKDLDRRSLALSRGLCAVGVAPGDHVTVWSDNRPDWIALQLALARIGAVLVTANVGLTEPEIGYLLKQSKSRFAIVAPGRKDTEYLDALAGLRSDPATLPELREVVSIDGPARDGVLSLEELVRAGEATPESDVYGRCRETTVDHPANIQYTSGTTGFPKGVVLTHGNLIENAWAGAQANGAVASDRVMLMVPLFHCFGCVVVLLGAYTHGLPLIAVQNFDPPKVLEAIAAERATILDGVPAMFLALLNHPDLLEHDLSSLRAGIVAGSMCPEPLMRRIHDEMGIDGIAAAYGLTEASPGVTISPVDAPLEQRLTTCGPPFPNVELRIVDPETLADRPAGERGEVLVKGPNVMLGYHDDPEATARAITPDGWLRTGDLGIVDRDGALVIKGRIKELVIRGGENVFPGEVEDALRTHPQVVDAAVFGVPDDRLGEEVAAAVIVEPGVRLTPDELVRWLESRLASYKRPRHWTFLATFPMTASGKVQKFKLVDLL